MKYFISDKAKIVVGYRYDFQNALSWDSVRNLKKLESEYDYYIVTYRLSMARYLLKRIQSAKPYGFWDKSKLKIEKYDT